jgi:hypothetical protein
VAGTKAGNSTVKWMNSACGGNRVVTLRHRVRLSPGPGTDQFRRKATHFYQRVSGYLAEAGDLCRRDDGYWWLSESIFNAFSKLTAWSNGKGSGPWSKMRPWPRPR